VMRHYRKRCERSQAVNAVNVCTGKTSYGPHFLCTLGAGSRRALHKNRFVRGTAERIDAPITRRRDGRGVAVRHYDPFHTDEEICHALAR
jgi:hypothetical protein